MARFAAVLADLGWADDAGVGVQTRRGSRAVAVTPEGEQALRDVLGVEA